MTETAASHGRAGSSTSRCSRPSASTGLAPEQRQLAIAIAERYGLDLMLKHLVLIEGGPTSRGTRSSTSPTAPASSTASK